MRHFTVEEGKLECILLSLTKIQRSLIGENEANKVLVTLTFYNIRIQLGYFVMYNATTNDTHLLSILL